MKRFLALAALVLGLASCQTEPEGLNVNVGGEVDTTITVTIPETETRAGGNDSALSVFENGILSGDATMRYIFQVYYNNNGQVVESQAEPQVKYSDDKTVNFDVRLVPGRNYTFVVWADVVDGENTGDKHYNTHNGENGDINLANITVNESSWDAMDESRDAFTVTEVIEQYNGQMGINLELKRALAKLRVITTDMKALNDLQIKPKYAKVEYTTAYRKGFNAVTGMAVEAEENGDTKTHTYKIAEYGDNGDNSVKKVLFTDYFFAANNQDDEVNFVLSVYENENEQNLIKSNPFTTPIPARRNYLTTIQGNILTDGNNIKVDVTDAFENASNLEDEPYYVEIWDGKTIKEPAKNEAGNYVIERGSELAWLAAAVNGTLPTETRATVAADSFAGKTFKLTQDIDLGGNEWTPISMSTDLAGGKTFRGTFDGNGHTIKGLYVRNQEVAGLFGYVYAATIKNVTIEGANLNSNHYAGGVVAWVLNTKGNIQVPFVMENCHVKNSTIVSTPTLINGEWDNGDKVGGLVGYAEINNDGAEIKDCSVKNTSIKAYRDFGGLIGYAKGVAINNYTIENVSLEQDLSHDYKAPNTPNTFGMIIGRNEGGNTINGGDYSYEAVDKGVFKVNDNYYIYNADGLKWLATEVNKYSNYERPFEGKTIYLTNDVNLDNMEWTPIGDYRFSANRFCGTFDGQNHTISNFKITKKTDKNDSNKSSYGFFGNLEGTLKNLTIANATVNSYAYTGALVGRFNNGLIENCHVVGCTVSNTYWQGGILIGQVNAEGNDVSAIVRNCSVKDSSVTSKSAIGVISGPVTAAKGGVITFDGCTLNNCTVNQQGSFGGNYDKYFGSMFGYTEADENSRINIKNCTANNTTVKGETTAPISGDFDGIIYINDSLVITSAEVLSEAIKKGGSYILGTDIAMTESVAISNANFTLDGNGYTITMTEDATNTYALFDITGGKAAIKNITFDGIKSGAIVRTVGVEFNAENVTAQNGQHTQQQGLFRLLGKSTVKDCTFKNNTCSMVITLNFDGANNDPQVVENCVFEGNTCNGTAVLYYVKGAGATINGNKFIGNTVNCNNNGATIYMGFTENNVVTNNLFQNNTVNEASESSRVAGAVFFGYETVFTGNAFVGNKVTGTNAKGNDVCVSTYYTDIDLSGNYWGGNAPVEDTNYFVQHKTSGYKVLLNNYLSVNPFN